MYGSFAGDSVPFSKEWHHSAIPFLLHPVLSSKCPTIQQLVGCKKRRRRIDRKNLCAHQPRCTTAPANHWDLGVRHEICSPVFLCEAGSLVACCNEFHLSHRPEVNHTMHPFRCLVLSLLLSVVQQRQQWQRGMIPLASSLLTCCSDVWMQVKRGRGKGRWSSRRERCCGRSVGGGKAAEVAPTPHLPPATLINLFHSDH